MVGTVGALHAPPPQQMYRDLGVAMTLVVGWAKGEREPLLKELEKWQQVLEENREVYRQASSALNEISKRNKEARELAEQAQAVHDGAMELKRTVEREAADARTTLAADQRAHETRVREFNDAASEHGVALTRREDELDARERDLERREAEVEKRDADARVVAREGIAMRDDYLARRAELRAVIERHA